MEKEHFEILLESMKSNSRLFIEGVDGVNRRLDRINDRFESILGQLGVLDRLEAGQEAIIAELRDINNAKPRLKDHIDNHS